MPAYRAELAHELPIAAARQVHRSVARRDNVTNPDSVASNRRTVLDDSL
ncbi:MAG: hypothetical protein ACI8P0_000688 [Planctomycetaceae bacterium]|jgi:hypothetical protein